MPFGSVLHPGSPREHFDLVFRNARRNIEQCRERADVLTFKPDGVAEVEFIRDRMSRETSIMGDIMVLAPDRSEEAQTLMSECVILLSSIERQYHFV